MGLKNLIGAIVMRGYMVTCHEGLIYLHDSQGKRWAEADYLSSPTPTVIVYKDNKKHVLPDDKAFTLFTLLEEYER